MNSSQNINIALPVVVIFERHWDEIPKQLVADLLPDLVDQGYDTLCIETPQNLTSSEITSRLDSCINSDSEILSQAERLLKRVNITKKLSELSFDTLADLMKLFVSSQKYYEVAEMIKRLPAAQQLKKVFDESKRLSVRIKGVDIDDKDYQEITTTFFLDRMDKLIINEDLRMRTISENLIEHSQRHGIIFICGALHCSNLIAKFKEKNLQDRVLYYFPHSSQRYIDSIDDINKVNVNENHTYLLSSEEVKAFKNKIVKEVIPKIGYIKEILEGNSHSRYLSELFGVNFQAFLRPGYYVDGLLDIEEKENIEKIEQNLTENNIQTRRDFLEGRLYLVISDINTEKVIKRISQLRFI